MSTGATPAARFAALLLLAAAAGTAFAQNRARDDDEPEEYRDRQEQRDAYRRGYERGYDRGFQRGLEEGAKRRPPPAAIAPPPPPAPPPPVLGPIKITSAFYGSSSKTCDATRWVARHANGKRTHSFKVTNDMCGDPHQGQRKTLEVVYWCGQVSRTASAREHQDLYLNCH
jgi:hypothetical protein